MKDKTIFIGTLALNVGAWILLYHLCKRPDPAKVYDIRLGQEYTKMSSRNKRRLAKAINKRLTRLLEELQLLDAFEISYKPVSERERIDFDRVLDFRATEAENLKLELLRMKAANQ